MSKEIKEVCKNDTMVDFNCYKVDFENNEFVLTFAKYNDNIDEISIQCQLKFSIDEFKYFFQGMLISTAKSINGTERNIIKELIDELKEKKKHKTTNGDDKNEK